MFLEAYNEFIHVYFRKEIWKMHFSHCQEKFSFENEIKSVCGLGKVSIILTENNSLIVFDTGSFEVLSQC